MAAKPKAMMAQLAPPSLLTRKTTISSTWSCFNFKFTSHASSSLMVKAKNETINTTTMVADRLNNKTTPWLLLPPEVDPVTGEKLDCFYSLADSQTVKLNRKKSLKVPDTAECIASTLGSWLGFADTKDDSLYLSNPFSNDVVKLPSLGTLDQVTSVEGNPKIGCILHFRVAPSYYDLIKDNDVMVNRNVSHLVLSGEDPRELDCVAMVVQSDAKRVAYCDIGKISQPDYNGAHVWYGLQDDRVIDIRNQVVYDFKNKLFYSLCKEGIIFYDVQKGAELFKFRHEIERKKGLTRWLTRLGDRVEYYLVTDRNSGDLWLIVRHFYNEIFFKFFPYKTFHFDVFRVSYPGSLERVTYLEDRAFFIGSNQSFCINADSFPGIRPNCIYFTDDNKLSRWGHDMGIFDMNNGKFTQFYPYQDEEEEKKVPMAMPLFWIAPYSSGLPRE